MARTVVVVDDHPLFRAGLRHVFAPSGDLKIVGEAEDARGARALAAELRPSAMLMDLQLPDEDGVSVIPDVLRLSPRMRIIALTMRTDEPSVIGAFVAGYATKVQSPAEIVGAVRAVLKGERYVPPGSSEGLVSLSRGGPLQSSGPFGVLSKREREVFELVIHSHTNREIAQMLGISTKTVETHRMRINRSLRVHSTGEVIRLAAIHGLFPGPPDRTPDQPAPRARG